MTISLTEEEHGPVFIQDFLREKTHFLRSDMLDNYSRV
ncbi:hypothetical protein MmTuc01_3234 [Methanosarcina mazei Tuc01]|jgi:hypothetical protein|nr:hypothetical protein MmTuc01_3234 [Methanosarcina mazei Tuc01]